MSGRDCLCNIYPSVQHFWLHTCNTGYWCEVICFCIQWSGVTLGQFHTWIPLIIQGNIFWVMLFLLFQTVYLTDFFRWANILLIILMRDFNIIWSSELNSSVNFVITMFCLIHSILFKCTKTYLYLLIRKWRDYIRYTVWGKKQTKK